MTPRAFAASMTSRDMTELRCFYEVERELQEKALGGDEETELSVTDLQAAVRAAAGKGE